MHTDTNTTSTIAPFSVKELAAKAKVLREEQTAIRTALSAGRVSAKADEAKAASDLLESIKSLGDTKVIVGEGDKAVEMSLEQALVSGLSTTIKVEIKGESKDRAHTAFMDAQRVASLTKLVVRFRKLCANVEIRPKENPKAEFAAA